MSFSRRDYIFSHTMTKVSEAHQPAIFKIDLRDLVRTGGCSALFAIDSMSLTAYKQGTLERIPVKFTVLDETKQRVLTNEPRSLSSKWKVDINGVGRCVKIAGTDTVPFERTPSVHDEENRQALVNVLAFMMSNSLWTSDRARGAFVALSDTERGAFEFKCDLCSDIGVARVTRGPSGCPSFSFQRCDDGYVCIPSHQPHADKDYEALRNVLALLRSASIDDVDMLKRVAGGLSVDDRAFRDLGSSFYPPRHQYEADTVTLSYGELKYITSLYQTMSEYADNFVVVDERTPHVKVLIESPADNLGEIVGRLTVTTIYGSSLSGIYNELVLGLRRAEEGREGEERQPEGPEDVAQLSDDVLIRRAKLNFVWHHRHIDSLKDWYNFYYGVDTGMHCVCE